MKFYTLFIAVVCVLICGEARADVTASEQGDATIQSSKGEVAVETIVKNKDKECPTGLTKKCVPGQPCFTNIHIDGEAAKQLWALLRPHGIKTNDALGDYVATNTDALACWDNNGTYNCTIGYDSIKNSMTSFNYCDPE